MAMTPSYRLAAVSAAGPGALDDVLSEVAQRLQARGVRVAGAVQHNTDRPGRRCDMTLTILPGAVQFKISEDRGRLSQGCRLDAGGLSNAVHALECALGGGFDALILNKFGAREAEGAGFLPALAEAVVAGVPILVGVGQSKRDALEAFVGAPVPVLAPDVPELVAWVTGAMQEVQGEDGPGVHHIW